MEQHALEVTVGISRQTDNVSLFLAASMLANLVLAFFALILGTTDLFEQHPLMVAWHKLMLAAVLVIAGEATAEAVEFPLARRIVLQLAGYVSGLALVLLWHPVQA